RNTSIASSLLPAIIVGPPLRIMPSTQAVRLRSQRAVRLRSRQAAVPARQSGGSVTGGAPAPSPTVGGDVVTLLSVKVISVIQSLLCRELGAVEIGLG